MNTAADSLQFTIPEILSIVGMAQCVYVLVYMSLRSGGWGRAALPFVYFLVLGLAFFANFARRFIGDVVPFYDTIDWLLWFSGPPLSVLLMIQIARITQPPPGRSFWILALVPLAYLTALAARQAIPETQFQDWLALTGFLAGVISMVAMWWQRPVLAQLIAQPGGRDRYWLILTLVLVNLFSLATVLLGLMAVLPAPQVMVIRAIWGLGFVYLAGTSLFRIYPQALRLIERAARQGEGGLSDDDHKLAQRIENLLMLDKVYHEPAYNRVSLAKELGVSETVISRVVNQHFGKTLPQLFNEYRVADAQRLLNETDVPIKTIAEEVGFNSIASFNRVFKDITTQSPGQYRETKRSA